MDPYGRILGFLPRGTLHPQKLAITSPTSGGRSVGIVRSRTQTMGFVFVFTYLSLFKLITLFYLRVFKLRYNEMLRHYE
jgi:hypothetical protein